MTLAAAEVAHFVGWVERLVRRSSTSEGGSETHHRPGQQLIDIAALHPSYKSAALEGLPQMHQPQNSDCPVDFVPEAHFGLNRDIATCLPRVPRAEQFREQDETLVQQPSS
jgi:hypothetical protein